MGITTHGAACPALLAVSVGLTTQMRSQWQLTLLWGVLVGSGTGVTSMVLAAIVANPLVRTAPRSGSWHAFESQRNRPAFVSPASRARGGDFRLENCSGNCLRNRRRRVRAGLSLHAEYARGVESETIRMGLKFTPSQAAGFETADRTSHSIAVSGILGAGRQLFVCGASTNGLIGTRSR